jgi:hypothetical protein
MLYTLELPTGTAKSTGEAEGASGVICDITELPKMSTPM